MIQVFFLFSLSFAGFSELPEDNLYQYKKRPSSQRFQNNKNKTVIVRKKRGRNKKNKIEKRLKKIMEEDKKIMDLLAQQEKGLILRKSDNKILALTRVPGLLLNSIVAMNIKPSQFVVKIDSNIEEIHGGEIRCLGHGFERRVLANCDLLVVDDQEFKVDLDIWGIDGAEGITADYYHSGEEKAFISSSFASFLEGVLDSTKDRIMTPFGETNRNNAKNKIMGGLMGVAQNVRSKINQAGEQKLSISFVNSGKKVIIFFNKTLNLEEVKQ